MDRPVLAANQEKSGTVITVSVDVIMEDHGVVSAILANAPLHSTGMDKNAFLVPMDKFGI